MSLTLVSTKQQPKTNSPRLLEMVTSHLTAAARLTNIEDMRHFNISELEEVRLNLHFAAQLLELIKNQTFDATQAESAAAAFAAQEAAAFDEWLRSDEYRLQCEAELQPRRVQCSTPDCGFEAFGWPEDTCEKCGASGMNTGARRSNHQLLMKTKISNLRRK